MLGCCIPGRCFVPASCPGDLLGATSVQGARDDVVMIDDLDEVTTCTMKPCPGKIMGEFKMELSSGLHIHDLCICLALLSLSQTFKSNRIEKGFWRDA